MDLIYSEKFAGGQVWLGDGKVQFGPDGFAIGVVKREGPGKLPAPQPLGESQFEAAAQSPSYRIVAAEDAPNPAVPPAEAPAEPQEVPVPPEVDEAPVAPPAEADGAAEAPDGAADEGENDPACHLDALDRRDLYRLAKDLGLAVEWTGSSAEDLRAAIQAHRGT